MLWLFIDVQAEDVRSGIASDDVEVEFPAGDVTHVQARGQDVLPSFRRRLAKR